MKPETKQRQRCDDLCAHIQQQPCWGWGGGDAVGRGAGSSPPHPLQPPPPVKVLHPRTWWVLGRLIPGVGRGLHSAAGPLNFVPFPPPPLQAAKLPMSIIIVGVGQAEFDGKATDGPIPPPLSSPCVPGAGEGGWGGHNCLWLLGKYELNLLGLSGIHL